MKRDMELIRKILLTIEEKTKPDKPFFITQLDLREDPKLITHHFELLYDAGLLIAPNGGKNRIGQPGGFMYYGISWEGYEFLDSIRTSNRWERLKETLDDSMSYQVIKQLGTALLIAAAKTELGW